MNIFAFVPSSVVSAQMLDDKRVGKMIIESGQLLTAAIRITLGCAGYSDEEIDALFVKYGILTVSKGTPWRLTHQNHPCSIWTRESYENYSWLVSYTLSLINEFSLRYDKLHGCAPAIVGMRAIGDEMLKPIMRGEVSWAGGDEAEQIQATVYAKELTPFVMAMPDEFKQEALYDPHRAYQLYHHSKPNVYWRKGRDAPDWWQRTEVFATGFEVIA